MASGIFVNFGKLTKMLVLEQVDVGDEAVVWRAELDGEERYVETAPEAEGWEVVDKVVHCYEES